VTLLQLIVLAIIQGLTEYLPVSSSAHLILGSMAFGWPDQGLVVDTATHLGTLLAVLLYFRRDLCAMARAWIRPADDQPGRQHRSMAIYLVLASIPVLLVGVVMSGWIELHLRDVRIVAWSTLLFGLLLGAAHLKGPQRYSFGNFSLKTALIVGLAQVLALIPGTSRSGITITAARFLGFTPDAAARFSFLLAIPVVAAAGLYSALKIAQGDAVIDWPGFLVAVGVSAVAGWVCIAAFLALLQRVGLMPFVIYRLILAGILFWLVY
jgi:undecaprenyl-diphosphatase